MCIHARIGAYTLLYGSRASFTIVCTLRVFYDAGDEGMRCREDGFAANVYIPYGLEKIRYIMNCLLAGETYTAAFADES